MPIFDALRDAWDIARRARGVGEIAKAVVPGLGPPIVLNEGDPPDLAPAELIRALRNARNELKAHVSSGRVDYRALRDVDALAGHSSFAPEVGRISTFHPRSSASMT